MLELNELCEVEIDEVDPLRHIYRQTISECANHKGFFRGYTSFTARPEGQTNIKLDAGAARHLSHPMTSVHDVENSLNVCFGMQRRMQCRISNCSGKLAMHEHIFRQPRF